MLERAGMRDPENGEPEDGSRRRRNEAVGQHAEPGVKLAHLLPPLIIDSPRGKQARADQQDHSDDDDRDTPAAPWPAFNPATTKGGVQPSNTCPPFVAP